jgi:hypothetical protein
MIPVGVSGEGFVIGGELAAARYQGCARVVAFWRVGRREAATYKLAELGGLTALPDASPTGAFVGWAPPNCGWPGLGKTAGFIGGQRLTGVKDRPWSPN